MRIKNSPEGQVRDLFSEPETASVLTTLLDQSEALYVKKLSLNDRDWARNPNKHQAGVYIPPAERDGGFFPPLVIKPRENTDAPEIREVFLDIEWPTVGQTRSARLVHYTSKGTETHLTRLPKLPFGDAAPASLLIIGRRGQGYRATVVDSQSDEYDVAHDALSLPPDFRSGVFALSSIRQEREDRAVSFIEEVLEAFFKGRFPELAARHSTIPTTLELSVIARQQYLEKTGLVSLDPFALEKPGDALRAISRGLEYEIFKDFQIRVRSIELARMLLGDDPSAAGLEKVLRSIILDFPKIDALLLSAAQQRKSRAGYSFEHHIEAMLLDGGLPFEKQVVLESKRRPDFIMPSRALYEDSSRKHAEVLVLSAKTTLRERWKQVAQEMRNCDLYLATVDENIADNAIRDMASQGIRLVVPESLKSSNTTEYNNQESVLSFKTFFEIDIRESRMPCWISRGIVGTEG